MEFDEFLADLVFGRVGVDLVDDNLVGRFDCLERETLLGKEAALIGGAEADAEGDSSLTGEIGGSAELVSDDGEEGVVGAACAGDEGVRMGIEKVGVAGGEGGEVASVGDGDGDSEGV